MHTIINYLINLNLMLGLSSNNTTVAVDGYILRINKENVDTSVTHVVETEKDNYQYIFLTELDLKFDTIIAEMAFAYGSFNKHQLIKLLQLSGAWSIYDCDNLSYLYNCLNDNDTTIFTLSPSSLKDIFFHIDSFQTVNFKYSIGITKVSIVGYLCEAIKSCDNINYSNKMLVISQLSEITKPESERDVEIFIQTVESYLNYEKY